MGAKKNEVVKTFAQWTDTHWDVRFTNNIKNISQYTDPFGTDTNSIPFTEDLLNQSIEKGSAMKPFKVYLKEGYAFVYGSISNKGVEIDYDKVNDDNLQWIARVYGTPKDDINLTLDSDDCVKCKTITVNTDSNYYETKFDNYSWGKKIYISPSYGPSLSNGESLSWYQGSCVSVKDGYTMPTVDQIKVEPESMRQYLEFEYVSGSQESAYNIYMYDRWDYDAGKYNQEVHDTIITFPTPAKKSYSVTVSLGGNITHSGESLTQEVPIGQPMTQINLVATNGMSFFPNVHNQSKDGITLSIDTSTGVPYTKTWISGTPLRDTHMIVPSTYNFEVRLESNMTTSNPKLLHQIAVLNNAIQNVVIKADSGYTWEYSNWSDKVINGVSIHIYESDRRTVHINGSPTKLPMIIDIREPIPITPMNIRIRDDSFYNVSVTGLVDEHGNKYPDFSFQYQLVYNFENTVNSFWDSNIQMSNDTLTKIIQARTAPSSSPYFYLQVKLAYYRKYYSDISKPLYNNGNSYFMIANNSIETHNISSIMGTPGEGYNEMIIRITNVVISDSPW